MLTPSKYFLDIKVEPSGGVLEALARIEAANTGSKPVTRISILLNRGLEVLELHTHGVQLKFFSQNPRETAGIERLRVNVVEAVLEKPLVPGQRILLEAKYRGAISSYDDVFPYVRDRISSEYTLIRPDSFSYPILSAPDFTLLLSMLPRQRFSYTLKIVVPKEFIVANVGVLESVKNIDGRRVYLFRSKMPSWRIDIAVSRFTVIEDRSLDIRAYILPEDTDYARRVLAEIPRCINLYRGLLGDPLNWAGYTVIEVPEGWGGQADIAGALVPANLLRSPEAVKIIYHELAHLWNPLSGENVPSRLLDEGIASYLQLVAEEKLLGGNIEARLEEGKQRLRELARFRPDLLTTPPSDYGRRGLTDASYIIGPWIFHSLRKLVGDSCFWSTLRMFLEHSRSSPAKLEDLVNVFTEACGMLAQQLRDWLFTASLAKQLIEKQ